VDIDLALIAHDLAALSYLLADAVEGRDTTGPPFFTGKVYGTKYEAIDELSRAAVRVGQKAVGLSHWSERHSISLLPIKFTNNRRLVRKMTA
jgi:hypothetical protein